MSVLKAYVKNYLYFYVCFAIIFTAFLPARTISAAPKIKLSKTSVTIKADKSKTIKLKKKGKKLKAKFSSNKPKIAGVGKESGRITGKKKGKCTITAVYKGKKYKCKVTVTKRASSKSDISKKQGNNSTETNNNPDNDIIDNEDYPYPIDDDLLYNEDYEPYPIDDDPLYNEDYEPYPIDDDPLDNGDYEPYPIDDDPLDNGNYDPYPADDDLLAGEDPNEISNETFQPEYYDELDNNKNNPDETDTPSNNPKPDVIYTPDDVSSDDTSPSDSFYLMPGADTTNYLKPYRYRGLYKFSNSTHTYTKHFFDMADKKYEWGVVFEAENKTEEKNALYNLDSQFSEVSFDVGRVEGYNSVDEGYITYNLAENNCANMYIYGDNNLIYNLEMFPDMKVQNVTINTKGVTQLKIVINGLGYYGIGNIIGHGGHVFWEYDVCAYEGRSKRAEYKCQYCSLFLYRTIPAQKECIPYLRPYMTKNVTFYNWRDNDSETFNVMGRMYKWGVAPEWNKYYDFKEWTYNLDSKYSSVTFSVGQLDSASSQNTTLYIYADGVEIKNIQLEDGMISKTVTINTEGVTNLKFRYDGKYAHYAVYDISYKGNIEAEHEFVGYYRGDRCINCGCYK